MDAFLFLHDGLAQASSRSQGLRACQPPQSHMVPNCPLTPVSSREVLSGLYLECGQLYRNLGFSYAIIIKEVIYHAVHLSSGGSGFNPNERLLP